MARAKTSVYFTGLTVQNVRPFSERQYLDLSDAEGLPARWTLILGDNGVGKTTLLECLASLRPTLNQDDDEAEVGQEFATKQLFIEPGVAWADNDKIFSMGRSGNIDFEMRAHLLRGASLSKPTKEQASFETRVSYRQVSGEFDDLTFSKQNVDDNFVEPFVLAYGAGRHMGVGNLDFALAPDATESLFDGTVALFDAEEMLQQFDYVALKRPSKAARNQRDSLIDVIVALLPDVEKADDIEIVGPALMGSKKESGVRVRTPYGEVALSQLSFGYQTMAAWIIDIAWRLFVNYPKSSRPLHEPAVVIVDEIDLHLHPRWQRQLRKQLSDHFPNVQFIATAHSPLMAQASLDANLAVLRREGDHVVVESDPEVVSTWRVDEVITSELFGLESPWPPEIESLFKEQRQLVEVLERTPQQERRLREVERQLEQLPTEKDAGDERALAIIRRAAAHLSAHALVP